MLRMANPIFMMQVRDVTTEGEGKQEIENS